MNDNETMVKTVFVSCTGCDWVICIRLVFENFGFSYSVSVIKEKGYV